MRMFWRALIRIMSEALGSPAAKKLRLEDTCEATASAAAVPKRKKCVLLVSYNGKGYLGMQRNPGVPTIEEELLKALSKAGAIPEELQDNPGKLHFQRCSRTDKGVSAARQVVSLKMVPAPSLLCAINSNLPEQIRVVSLKRVTKSFNSWSACSARHYEYLLPTYAFAPYRLTGLDFRVEGATLQKVRSLLRCYVGTHNFHNFTSRKKFTDPQSNRYITSFECGDPYTASSSGGEEEGRVGEFLVLRVEGQSFMLHQIRKMIGLVIAVVRGYTDDDAIARSFESAKLDIPRAPGLGLLLDAVLFERYNRRIAGDGQHDPLQWQECHSQVEAFKKKHIYQSIIDTELSSLFMQQWLGSLQLHTFQQTVQEEAEKERTAAVKD